MVEYNKDIAMAVRNIRRFLSWCCNCRLARKSVVILGLVVACLFIIRMTIDAAVPYRVYVINLTSSTVKHVAATTMATPATVNYNSLVEAIASKASRDRYIVLVMVDETFVDMAINLHETSFRPYRIDNYLFVGVGNSTCEALGRHRLACYHYVNDRSAGRSSNYGSADFIRKMNIRTDMILEALAANFTVVHADVDVVFLENPFHEVKVDSSVLYPV